MYNKTANELSTKYRFCRIIDEYDFLASSLALFSFSIQMKCARFFRKNHFRHWNVNIRVCVSVFFSFSIHFSDCVQFQALILNAAIGFATFNANNVITWKWQWYKQSIEHSLLYRAIPCWIETQMQKFFARLIETWARSHARSNTEKQSFCKEFHEPKRKEKERKAKQSKEKQVDANSNIVKCLERCENLSGVIVSRALLVEWFD